MDELLKLLLSMMLEGSDNEHQKEEQKEQPDNTEEVKDFKSLVSYEEVEAIKDLKKAMDNLVNVHLAHVDKMKNPHRFTAQQRVHFMLFCDILQDTVGSVNCLHTINTLGVKSLEESRKEHKVTYEDMEKAKYLNEVLGL